MYISLFLPFFFSLISLWKKMVVDGSCGDLIAKTRAEYNADYKERDLFHQT